MSADGLDPGEGLPVVRFRPTADDLIAASDLIWRASNRRLAVIGAAVVAICGVVG